MKSIRIRSYAKINLSLDVTGINDDGYHEVSMVMQQINLYDEVLVRVYYGDSGKDGIDIELSSNRPYLPRDEKNIAYKAAALMADRFGNRKDLRGSRIRIDLKKNIPVAAGLAGGSGNAAAVLHALNKLWHTGLSLKELMDIGAELGSDVPFCIMGQAAAGRNLDEKIRNDRYASFAALAEGTGTLLTPVAPLKAYVLLMKPPLSISTKEVYSGIDDEIAKEEKSGTMRRPDNKKLISAINDDDKKLLKSNMINVLELYTLGKYKAVRKAKERLMSEEGWDAVLMSGSGPTVYALYSDFKKAEKAYGNLKGKFKEIYLVKTGY